MSDGSRYYLLQTNMKLDLSVDLGATPYPGPLGPTGPPGAGLLSLQELLRRRSHAGTRGGASAT